MKLQYLLILGILWSFAVSAPLSLTLPATHSSLSVKRPAIEERVKTIIAEQLGLNLEEVTNEASFAEDLHADDLDITKIIMHLETAFDISIPDEDAAGITTVQAAIDYVKDHDHNYAYPS